MTPRDDLRLIKKWLRIDALLLTRLSDTRFVLSNEAKSPASPYRWCGAE